MKFKLLVSASVALAFVPSSVSATELVSVPNLVAPSPERETPTVEDVDPFDSVMDVAKVNAAARARFGPRFSGAWIDRQSTPTVYRVAVVGATSADDAELKQIAGSSQIAAVSHAFSESFLLEARSRITQLLTATTEQDFAVFVDDVTESVTVSVESSTASMESALKALVAPVPLRLFSGYSYSTQHVRRISPGVYEAGLRVTLTPPIGPTIGNVGSRSASTPIIEQATINACTSNFLFKRDPGFGDPIEQYGVTAGHCGDVGWNVNVTAKRVSESLCKRRQTLSRWSPALEGMRCGRDSPRAA